MVGDLWERYLQLLDEGVADGYAIHFPSLFVVFARFLISGSK